MSRTSSLCHTQLWSFCVLNSFPKLPGPLSRSCSPFDGARFLASDECPVCRDGICALRPCALHRCSSLRSQHALRQSGAMLAELMTGKREESAWEAWS